MLDASSQFVTLHTVDGKATRINITTIEDSAVQDPDNSMLELEQASPSRFQIMTDSFHQGPDLPRAPRRGMGNFKFIDVEEDASSMQGRGLLLDTDQNNEFASMSLGKNNRFSFDKEDTNTFEIVDEVQLLQLPVRHFSRAGSVIGSIVDRRSQYMKRSVINTIASAATQTEHFNVEQSCQTQISAETGCTQTEACTAATCTQTESLKVDQALQAQVDVTSTEAQTKDASTISTEAQTESRENLENIVANSEASLVQATTWSSISESTQTACLQTSQATQSSQLVCLLTKHTQTASKVPPLNLQDLATDSDTASARTLQSQSCQTQ